MKSDREREISYDIAYMWTLKRNDTYLQNRKTHRLRERTYGYQGEGIVRELRIDMYTLLYIEWINNKVLLYSAGNYIQYPVINDNGKEYEKECIYIYICITESLCCTPETNTTL